MEICFIIQTPLKIPDNVLGQLGNRVKHALRALTPRDQKAVRATARTFRSNSKLDVEATITQPAVGEALVSLLDEKGAPRIVERALVRPPQSLIGPIPPERRQQIIQQSPVAGVQERVLDRESAHEILKTRTAHARQRSAPASGSPVLEFNGAARGPLRTREFRQTGGSGGLT